MTKAISAYAEDVKQNYDHKYILITQNSKQCYLPILQVGFGSLSKIQNLKKLSIFDEQSASFSPHRQNH